MKEIERVKRELAYEGSVIKIYKDTVQFPDGHQAQWDFIYHKGGAAVLPVKGDKKVLMVRQYRNAADQEVLEIPGGAYNYVGEPCRECAARELEEETGYRAGRLEHLLDLNTSIALSNEKLAVFAAFDLEATSQRLDEDEFLNVEEWDLDELVEMIYQGKLTDSKTVAAILAYKQRYE